MKKIYLIASLVFAGLLLNSCNDWLNVTPKHLTEEEELFSREIGFKETLTGAYQLSAKSNLYGKQLSFGMMDILAQRYRFLDYQQGDKDAYQDPLYYEYPSELTEGFTATTWSAMFTVIANLNNMLSWIEVKKDVLFTPHYYEIIKGEALGLRSYLYFDLVRMYGPVYKENPTGKSVPYRTEFNRDFKDLVPADQMLGYIIADLKQAEELLTGTDPLNFDYVGKTAATSEEDPFLIFRFKRMNLMAVKALLARVYLYMNDTVNAANYAREVVESGLFSLTTNNANDPILSSEVIFGVHVDNFIEDVSEGTFTDLSVSALQYVITGDEFFNEVFPPADGSNDFRVKDGVGFTHNGNYHIMQKYVNQNRLHYGMQEMVPMIRLAEMYYILCECETDLQASTAYLNMVRRSRGILALDSFANEAEKAAALELEYRKEFYGEGQLWYYYKRTFARTFLHSPLARMEQRNYTFNVPDDEYTFGGVTD